eukprot:s4604_g2.t1
MEFVILTGRTTCVTCLVRDEPIDLIYSFLNAEVCCSHVRTNAAPQCLDRLWNCAQSVLDDCETQVHDGGWGRGTRCAPVLGPAVELRTVGP